MSKYTLQQARDFVSNNQDDDDLDDEEVCRAFVAIFDRHPDDSDREQGLWSLLCQAVDD